MIRLILVSLVTLITINGCAPAEPPGPAERLGKSIDQLTKDINDISDEMDKKQEEREKKQAQLRNQNVELTPTPTYRNNPGSRPPFNSRYD